MSLFVAAALSACDFGGEATSSDGDRLSELAVVQATPADGQIDTERSTSVTAEFDAALDAASVDSTRARIAGPEGNTMAATVAVEGNGLRLQPAVPLPGGTTYTVTLDRGISDTSGRPLLAPKTLRFTTKAQVWQPQLTVAGESDGFQDWLWPEATADDKGNVLVAWVQPGWEKSLVTVARLDGATGRWGKTVVFPTASHLVGWPRVFTAADGDAYMVWSEDGTDGITAYMTSFRAKLGTWSTPVRLAGVPAGTASVTPLVERNGNITLVCKSLEHLLVTRYDAAQARWSEPIAIEQTVEGRLIHVDARLVADARGNVLLAWTQLDETWVQPAYATRFDSAARRWAAVQKMATDTISSVFFPQAPSFAIGVDAKGNATMAWSEYGETTHVMVAQFDSSTGRWAEPVRIAQGGQANVVVDPAGFATVAWQQDETLFAARRAPGATAWGPPMRIGDREPFGGFTAGLQLATDVAGNVTAVYAVPNSGSRITASRFSVDTGQWSTPQGIDAFEGAEELTFFWGSPAIAVDGSGTVTAAWLAYRSGKSVLATNRLR